MSQQDAADIRAWIALARAHRAVLGHVETALKESGLPPLAWYDVLLELDRAGEGGLRPYALEERLLLPQYGLSRLLTRIADAGLIERHPCARDRRGFTVALTEDGRRMRRRMWPIYRAAVLAAVGKKLPEDKTDALADLLTRLA